MVVKSRGGMAAVMVVARGTLRRYFRREAGWAPGIFVCCVESGGEMLWPIGAALRALRPRLIIVACHQSLCQRSFYRVKLIDERHHRVNMQNQPVLMAPIPWLVPSLLMKAAPS